MASNQNTELVWYLSYGSNLLKERFMCYIEGGRPKGSDKVYKGCLDKAPPQDSRSDEISYPLYFAHWSDNWHGGIAFIRRRESDEEGHTVARRYLITKGQLEGVVAQENSKCDGDTSYAFDLQRLLDKGTLSVGNRLYDYLMLLGYDEDAPIVTLTTSRELSMEKPSPAYATIIALGLRETCGMSPDEACSYLYKKDGIEGLFEKSDLLSIIQKAFEETAANA